MPPQDKFNSIKTKNISLKKIQDLIDEWIMANGGYWPPLSMLASVTEELGEVAREINHLEKYKIKKATEPKNNLETELGDTLFSLVCIANHYNIDLSEAFKKTMEKYTKRDWDRFLDHNK